jgi:3-hydroxybutyryl-CoA dehydrogenase
MTKVTVVGAGIMGHGIAQVAALAGCETTVTDNDDAALDNALGRIQHNLDGGITRGKISRDQAAAALSRIRLAASLEEASRDADIVIEAVVEDLAVKQNLLRLLDSIVIPSAILASNTSSLSVGDIAKATTRPGRVLGMHFFNPAHIMKLVEIVVHEHTTQHAVDRARTLAEAMGKQPILVRDTPGFASSRLGVVLGLEAMRMLEQDVASAEDIDKAMELGYGHPMGPLRVSDLVGLDVRLAIAEYLHEKLGGEHYRPPEILKRKVQAGELGRKSGRGFHDWSKAVGEGSRP